MVLKSNHRIRTPGPGSHGAASGPCTRMRAAMSGDGAEAGAVSPLKLGQHVCEKAVRLPSCSEPAHVGVHGARQVKFEGEKGWQDASDRELSAKFFYKAGPSAPLHDSGRHKVEPWTPSRRCNRTACRR